MADYVINVTEQSGRIDKVLVEALQMSRSQIQLALKQQRVTVNGEIVKANYKVQSGDHAVVHVPEVVELAVEPENIALDIVYEDDAVVVVNKKSGMVVHPSVGHENGTLVNALLYHFKSLSNGTQAYRPGIVHRIDKDTSGLLVIAKTNEAHQFLASQLEQHTMQREYIALVHGVIEHETGTVDGPLARAKNDRLKWVVQEGGKRAITHFTVLERFDDATLLSLKLETGRTHQIRAHMQFIKHDIFGDPVYSKYADDKQNGQFLHAKTLGFQHPDGKRFLQFEAPLPSFFEEKLNVLRRTIDQ